MLEYLLIAIFLHNLSLTRQQKMNKLQKKLLWPIFMFTILVCFNLYGEPSFYHFFTLLLGILVGSFIFFRTPKARLDEWLFSKKPSKQQFIGLMLIMCWPLLLPIFINYETADYLLNSNFIFVAMTYWTIMILYFIRPFDSFDEQ